MRWTTPTPKTIPKGDVMMKNFDDANKMGKEMMDGALTSYAAMSKGMQAIAAEMTEYSKKSYESGVAAAEKLAGVKSLDKMFEVQADYMKGAYESFVAQATKMNEMFTAAAKDAYKPYEAAFSKASA